MNTVCRPSTAGEVPRLKALWKRCFGDEDGYIDHYFRTFYRPERALVLEAEGTVASMLLTFPFAVCTSDGACMPACYIYAFCTDPALQGRGYGRRLLSCGEDRAARAGCAAALMVPGEQSLFQFYESLGYESTVFCREQPFFPGQPGRCFPRPCTAEFYNRQREKWLKGLNHIRYPLPVLEYQKSLCRNAGGGFYDLGGGVAAAERDENQLLIRELLTDDPEAAASALLGLLGGETARVRLPVLPGETGQPFGVVKWLTPFRPASWANGWLAFGFD